MSNSKRSRELEIRITGHLKQIYSEYDCEVLCERLISEMDLTDPCIEVEQYKNHWDEKDVAVITYGNTFLKDKQTPLDTLHRFLTTYLRDEISIVHILPFFPFSSDDGFAVLEYTQVNDAYGDWENIVKIATDFKLMSDLVINHCSGRSRWFEQLKSNEEPGKNYFCCVEPDTDLSAVVRPRTSPLLREVETSNGKVWVWCTFSHDQPDLNFRNPDVLLEFARIIRLYLERGVRIFRLDAIAFLWKEPGTNCINLPQTHEIVRLFRILIEHHTADAIIITETNIPNRENLAYFGNGNEAHIIYNFSLPPLLLHMMVSGNSHYFKNWLMSMPPAMMGTTYLNFFASHDGIGLRPAEGLLSEDEISELVQTMESFGGQVSWRALDNDQNRPYEINITLYDALKGTIEEGSDQWQVKRFICAHAIMLGLEGIPAFYIHSLLATENDYEKLAKLNRSRAINRHNWQCEELEEILSGEDHHANVFTELKRLISIRKMQAAFHPNATQFTLHLGDNICAFWRQSLTRDQSIFALHNITAQSCEVLLSDINLIETDDWFDLITDTQLQPEQTRLQLEPYQSVWLSNKVLS